MSTTDLGTDDQRRRSLVDTSRKDGSLKSYSVETLGDFKFFWGTTGVVAVLAKVKVYLTVTNEVAGANLYTKVMAIQVLYDGEATAGGFLRGQGPLSPTSTYVGVPHSDWELRWDVTEKKWYVEVENTLSTTRDFAVHTQGI